MTSKVSSSISNVSARLAAIVVLALVTIITIIEIAVALNFEIVLGIVKNLITEAMWAATILWDIVTAVAWGLMLKKDDESPLWIVLFFTLVTIAVTGGIFIEWLHPFTVWANAVISLAAFIITVIRLPHWWRAAGASTVQS